MRKIGGSHQCDDNGVKTVRRINARDFKNQFDEFLSMAKAEPIAISEFGKPVAVVVSAEEYEHLQRLDDAYWRARAEGADAKGEWIGHDQAMPVLTERLTRDG